MVNIMLFAGKHTIKNYNDYQNAIGYFQCPGQNFAFACKNGVIAIQQQGAFIAKWTHQGEFVMPGTDSSYMWQGVIPNKESPLMYNPARGFVSSANQMAGDTTYPYYLGREGNSPIYRGIIIKRFLSQMQNITPEIMLRMRTNNHNVFAEMARPALLKYLDEKQLTPVKKRYIEKLKSWNLVSDYDATAPTIFECFWDSVFVGAYADELNSTGLPYMWPDQSTLVEAMINDSNYIFADDIRTKDVKENMQTIVQQACKKACAALEDIEKDGRLPWGKFKDTYIGHLLNIPAFSKLHVPIGGGANIINATTANHGPSWRMIVQLTDKTVAYGVYPGGQSGNPGSFYYDNFIEQLAAGKYYPLLFLTRDMAEKSSEIKWHLQRTNA
jgi:penicillin amidase